MVIKALVRPKIRKYFWGYHNCGFGRSRINRRKTVVRPYIELHKIFKSPNLKVIYRISNVSVIQHQSSAD